MKNSRREFLKKSAQGMSAMAMLSCLGHLSSESVMGQTSSGFQALVCIFLEGGNDGLNMVIPYEQTAYNEYQTSRPGIAIPRDQLLQIAAPNLDSNNPGGQFGLHPDMSLVQGLYNQGKLAVLANVGTMLAPIPSKTAFNSNRSLYQPKALFDHYQQQIWWQTLDHDGSNGGWGNGIGRYTSYLNPAAKIPMLIDVNSGSKLLRGQIPSITLQPGAALSLDGISATNPPARGVAMRQLLALRDTSTQVNALAARTNNALNDIQIVSQVLANSTAVTTVFPNTSIGNQLRQIARIIAARETLGLSGRQIFYAQMGGFDTHTSQLTAHANLMKNLSEAMKAFYDATVELNLANQVTSFTLSEFGRTVRNNQGDVNQPGSLPGTDHGWGNHHFVMGGAVKGGRVYGRFPSLLIGGPDEVFGGCLPGLGVDQYGATLAKWFGMDDTAINDVFVNLNRFNTKYLNFI
jgi:uncharacterized protein (DUF1501 family)